MPEDRERYQGADLTFLATYVERDESWRVWNPVLKEVSAFRGTAAEAFQCLQDMARAHGLPAAVCLELPEYEPLQSPPAANSDPGR